MPIKMIHESILDGGANQHLPFWPISIFVLEYIKAIYCINKLVKKEI
jgi:hypothetical protein